MRRSLQFASLTAVLLVLAGCGNKGPLYMPPATPATPVKPTVPAKPKPTQPVPASTSSSVSLPAMPTPDATSH